jgi:hypothetical protein
MRPPGWVQPLAEATEPAGELVLQPIVCPHAAMSHALIEEAAAEVSPGRVLILGAGACREIPLVALAQRFAAVVLVDEDAAGLAAAMALIAGAPCRAEVATEQCDLTGIAQALIDGAAACLADATTPEDAEAGLCALIDGAQPQIAGPAAAWDLVIASCVGTQLHLRALHAIVQRHAERFPHGPSIGASAAWTAAMLRLSWRLQDAFVARALDLVTADGRLYLADTVQVGTVYARLDGTWRTPGWYRMTRSRFLSELFPAIAQPVHGGQWPHVVAVPSHDAPGLVYNVHAAVLARRAT